MVRCKKNAFFVVKPTDLFSKFNLRGKYFSEVLVVVFN